MVILLYPVLAISMKWSMEELFLCQAKNSGTLELSGTYRLIGLAPALSHSNRTTTNCLKKGYPSLDSFPISLLFTLTFYFIIYSLYCMYPVSPA